MGRVLSNVSEPDHPDAECAIRLVLPEQYAGSSMSEFQSRGGCITGMDVQSGIVILRGSLPAAEFQAFREIIAVVTQRHGSVERE